MVAPVQQVALGRKSGAGARPLPYPPPRLVPERSGARARAVLLRQIFTSGVRALPLVCVVAFGAGAAIVLQSSIAPTPPSAELGRMLVVVMLRELAPLLTAIVLAGHSAGMLVAGVASAVVDPAARRAQHWPRVAGMAVACATLAVYFAVSAMLGGFLTSQALTVRTFDAVRAGLQQELSMYDLPLFAAKTLSLGAFVGALGCALAPSSVASPAAFVRATSRVFTWSLLGCTLLSAGLTAVLYALVGAPQPP